MQTFDTFWTDEQQTIERLLNTVIMYDEEPYYVKRVFTSEKDGDIRLVLIPCGKGDGVKETRKKANSPLFQKFRNIPTLGWVNLPQLGNTACYCSRNPVRNRQHGLSEINTTFETFDNNGVLNRSKLVTFNFFIQQPQFFNLCTKQNQGNYPTLQDVLREIPISTAFAISPLYAVYRDDLGYRQLMRKKDAIGIFTGENTLYLPSSGSCYKEEIMEDPVFTINTLMEY